MKRKDANLTLENTCWIIAECLEHTTNHVLNPLQHLPKYSVSDQGRNLFSNVNMSSQREFALITVPDLLGTEVDLHGGTPTAVN